MANLVKVACSFLLVFLFGFSLGMTQSGKREITWNYLPDEHRDMVEYSFDKEAVAVVLHDVGIWAPTSLEEEEIRMQRHRRIKILKEDGVRFKEVVLDYQAGEEIKNLKARTINWEDGKKKVTKLKLKYLPEETVGLNQRRKSFSFRDVKPGSIIEYQYELESSGFEFLKTWYFQDKIPTVHSEVRIDNFGPFAYRAFPQILEIRPYRKGRYRMRHVRGISEEPFVGNWNDYRVGIKFQLKDQVELRDDTREWQLITMDLQQGTLFLDDEETQQALYSLTRSLTREAITDQEKVAIIFNHIRDHVKWNGISDTWMTKTPSQTYKDQAGSSVEINMLLTQMYWLANLEAHRLFYRTRKEGLPVFEPLRNQFNDMLCVVKADGQTFFLDATDPLRPYDLIPQRALNRMGWLVKDSTANWVKIPGRFPSSISVAGLMSINEDGYIQGECKEIRGGYEALAIRKKLKEQDFSSFMENYLTDYGEISAKKTQNLSEYEFPVSVLFEAGTDAFTRKGAA
jgi:hypothetical protein